MQWLNDHAGVIHLTETLVGEKSRNGEILKREIANIIYDKSEHDSPHLIENMLGDGNNHKLDSYFTKDNKKVSEFVQYSNRKDFEEDSVATIFFIALEDENGVPIIETLWTQKEMSLVDPKK